MLNRNVRLTLESLDRRDLPTATNVIPVFATGAGPGGGPHVKVYNQMFAPPLHEFFAYSPAFLGGVRVATGDVSGDGVEDIITGPGPGGGSHIRVFDGRFGRVFAEFFAFDANYTGGVFVAAADVNGDNRMEIVVSGSPGTLPTAEVRVFTVQFQPSVFVFQYPGLIGRFFPYTGINGSGVAGGCSVAAVDYNRDGFDDIVVGAPSGFVLGQTNNGVKIFNGLSAAQLISVNAVGTGGVPNGRVYVAAGDVTGDGIGDVVYSVKVSNASVGSSTQILGGLGLPLLKSFNAYPGFPGESCVAVENLDRTGPCEIVTGAGFSGQPLVKFHRFIDLAVLWPFIAYQNFNGGVWIG